MITWAEFTFPPLNLYNIWPNYKEWYRMSGGIESMFEDEKDNFIVNKGTPYQVNIDYSTKKSHAINWDHLDKEVKNWTTSTAQVVKDLRKREAIGLQKYGKALTVNTDEDMLNHLYNELLDGAVYIRTLLSQRSDREYDPHL